MKKFETVYSGIKSKRFWEAIWDHKKSDKLYKLGVKLQNLEEKVLKELNV